MPKRSKIKKSETTVFFLNSFNCIVLKFEGPILKTVGGDSF